MKKILIYTMSFVVLTVVPVSLTVIYYQRALDVQRVFLLETFRVEVINLGEQLNRLSSEDFEKRLICKIYARNESYKEWVRDYDERFLREADVFPEMSLYANYVYGLFQVSEVDLMDRCGKVR